MANTQTSLDANGNARSTNSSRADKLQAYLDVLASARSAAELDAAIRADFRHSYRGKTWSRISQVRLEAADRIIRAHPLANFVPLFESGRRVTVCGESYRRGRAYNGAGARYAQHGVDQFIRRNLQDAGFGIRASHRIVELAKSDYPHRTIAVVEAALHGSIPDPKLNVLKFAYHGTGPVRLNAEDKDRRASRPCSCGGRRWDWGAGHVEGFETISWHCDRCARVYVEYITSACFYEIRQSHKLTRADLLSRKYRKMARAVH